MDYPRNLLEPLAAGKKLTKNQLLALEYDGLITITDGTPQLTDRGAFFLTRKDKNHGLDD